MVEVYQSRRVRTSLVGRKSQAHADGDLMEEATNQSIRERYVSNTLLESNQYHYCFLCFLICLSLFFVSMLLLFGGVFFMILEYDNYEQMMQNKIDNEAQLTAFHEQYNVSAEYLSLLDTRIELANIREENKWDIPTASYFAITIVSTIGFGWWAPLTDGGKVFMIFFALVGCPIFLYASFQYVSVLMILLAPSVAKLSEILHIRYTEVSALIFLWIGTLILASITFYSIEDWNLLDSVYFCIETGSTIALGDLEPVEEWTAFTALVNFHCFMTFIGATLMLLEVSTTLTGKVFGNATKWVFPSYEKTIEMSEGPRGSMSENTNASEMTNSSWGRLVSEKEINESEVEVDVSSNNETTN